ncbi:hypothetical protein D3C72_555780 [compost metagenome]
MPGVLLRVFGEAQGALDILRAFFDQRVVGVFEQRSAVDWREQQRPDPCCAHGVIARRQHGHELLATAGVVQRCAQLAVEISKGVEEFDASCGGKQQGETHALVGLQVLDAASVFFRDHKGAGQLNGGVLIAELQRVHGRTQHRHRIEFLQQFAGLRVQQAVGDGLSGFVADGGEACVIFEEGFRRFIVDPVALIHVDQLGGQPDFQGGDQLFAFVALQIAVFQRLIQLAAALQVAGAIGFQLFVEAFQKGLFGTRFLFGKQWG